MPRKRKIDSVGNTAKDKKGQGKDKGNEKNKKAMNVDEDDEVAGNKGKLMIKNRQKCSKKSTSKHKGKNKNGIDNAKGSGSSGVSSSSPGSSQSSALPLGRSPNSSPPAVAPPLARSASDPSAPVRYPPSLSAVGRASVPAAAGAVISLETLFNEIAKTRLEVHKEIEAIRADIKAELNKVHRVLKWVRQPLLFLSLTLHVDKLSAADQEVALYEPDYTRWKGQKGAVCGHQAPTAARQL